jgi:predicted transcriptional regulator
MGHSFSKRDKEFVNTLVKIGMSRNIAKIIVFFSKKPECCCRDLQECAQLRQPEVSMAMQELNDMGWVVIDTMKRESKGRPVNMYKLAMPMNKIIKSVINKEKEKIKERNHNITKLKSFIH